MAEFPRRTILANPARPRRKPITTRNPKRRRLSAAQIAAGFGGKRRRARVKPPAKRLAHERPHAKPRKAQTHRANPGDIITLALANPAARKPRKSTSKGSSHMASPRKRRRSTARQRTAAPRRRRRTNPVARPHRRRRARRHNSVAAPRRRRRAARRNPSVRRRRRNPYVAGIGARTVSSLVVQAGWAIGGAVGSKLLTQAVLGASNTGWMGYGGNLAASFVLGAGIKAFMKNESAGNAVILGGVIQTLLRVLIDKTPFGSRVSNLGMGDYLAQNYLTPQRVVDGLNSAQLAPPSMPMMGQPKNGGMSGIQVRNQLY